MTAKYKIVANALEEELFAGKYKEAKKLPTEEELGARFDVSRNTIRKAIELLVKKGYVYQIHGSGIFIREVAFEGYMNASNFRGLTKDFPNQKVETKVLDFKLIECDEELAKQMRCEVGDPIYYINRLRIINGIKMTVEYSYYNKNVIPYLSMEIVESSIYNYIRNDLKMTIGIVDRITSADFIDKKDAELLELPEGSPTIINENKASLRNGEVFDVSRAIHNYKHTKILTLSNLLEY